jgi:hypothetical protein
MNSSSKINQKKSPKMGLSKIIYLNTIWQNLWLLELLIVVAEALELQEL